MGSFSSDGLLLYFSADRRVDDFGVESRGGMDIFVATRATPGGPFEAVRNVQELNTRWDDAFPAISPDGLTIFWSDFAPPSRGKGGSDIFMATRSRPEEAFGDPVKLEWPINSEITDFAPLVSADWPAPGSKLYFARGTGPFDLWLYEATWHPDCNGNEVDDLVDIAGEVPDVNRNDIPDECEPSVSFRRGDSNADHAVNIADGVSTLVFLFAGGEEPPCRDAADTDDSGQIDINDAIGTFNWLFQGAAAPAPPGHQLCGEDPTEDDLGCADPPDCP